VHRTSLRLAPSAERMPISCVRSETEKEMIPERPVAVMTKASAAKMTRSMAVRRDGASDS